MLARFFVDRPIFATVISVVITLAGGVAVFTLPIAQYPEVTPPTVQVTALYPGANALTVLDTVAAPIEEQVSGVEGMMYMTSRCTNDGAYNLTVTFKLGTDSDMAQVLVQNRVSLALPVIPALVQNEGINVKKMSPNTLMIVNLISPDNRYNDIYLSNYATIYVRDELGRLPGVGSVTYLGQRDYSLRVWLEADKMAALNLSGMDVVTAIAQQNLQVAAGQIGQQPVPRGQQYQLAINTKGRLVGPEEFGDIIIKTSQTNAQPATTQSAAARPAPPAIGIVRIRDVVRENKYFLRVPLDLQKVEKAGLTPQRIRAELEALRIRARPDPDTVDEAGKSLTWMVSVGGPRAPTADELGETVVEKDKQGNPVRLASLVTKDGIVHLAPLDEEGVQLGSQQYDQSCTLDGRPSVALSIFQLPGSNALDTATGVYAKMKDLKKSFPDGLDYQIVYDTTPFIRESVNEVFYTLRDAVILVAIVVLVFLQDWRAMILPMIDVPVSLIGTFAVMAAMHFTLNNLTLFGLVLAIGIVVDDAIVVLENIERLIATGLDARTATIKAMEEITGPVLAITLVLASVFIPCCFLGGVTGQFFRQFAVTIAVSTIISAINAITMTPSRAVLIFQTEGDGKGHEHRREALPWWIFGIVGGVFSVLYGPELLAGYIHLPPNLVTEDGAAQPGWGPWLLVTTIYFTPGALLGGLLGLILIRPVNRVLGLLFRWFNVAFDRMTLFYGALVGRMLRFSVVVLVIYAGLLVLTYTEFNRTPTGFIPQQDKGYLLLNVQLPDSASVERTQRIMARIESLARQTPGVAHTVGVSGTSLILNANAPNLGSLYIMLKPFDERHSEAMSAGEIGNVIQERCRDEVRGGVVSVFGAPPIDGLGTTGGFTLIVEDRGNSGLDQLQRFSDKIVARGKKSEGLQGLFNSSGANTPWLYLDIDRTKCMTMGVAVSDVFAALQVYMGSYYVNNYNQFGRTWQVNVQADPSHRYDVTDIKQLQVRNNQGQMVRLGSLMDVRDTGGPVMVMRYNMYSAAAITGDAAPGISSGQAMALMEELAESELPQSMKPAEWTDLAYLQVQAGNSAMYFFALAVIFVFLVLAAQYESWKFPLAVILVVPMCLFCSIVGLQIAQMDVNIFTQIGFVVLVGLASKNAILIVEFAKQAQEAGKSAWDATVEACKLRLRPILMTSFAFILGVVPLVIAHGAGAEMRRSLGLAVFSGMLGVTLFGVFLTPVFFYVITWFSAPPTARPKPALELNGHVDGAAGHHTAVAPVAESQA
jgi:multidrug efflux pump